MKNTLTICSEYITGTPVSDIIRNLVEEVRYNGIKKNIDHETLESLCMNFSEIDFIAAEKLREEVLENIEVKNINTFLWEHGFFANLEQKYGNYFSKVIDLNSESFSSYISEVSTIIANRIITTHIQDTMKEYYDADKALYHRAKIYMEGGYISKHLFFRVANQLGKTLRA